MAMQAVEITIGVDVAKGWLDVAAAEDQAVQRVDNTAAAIGGWLRQLSGVVRLAVEPTGSYHELLVEAALAAGHTVYLVEPLRLARYRDAVGQRAKTDEHDALLLRRYLLREGSQLRPWQGVDARAQRVWRLLKRRATVVRAGVQIRQSLGELEDLGLTAEPVFVRLRALLRQIDRQLLEQARAAGWSTELQRLQTIPGVGLLTALGLIAAYHRGVFTAADRFVAFLGLDVRVRDSGKYRGRRRLTKKGDAEVRRLLYNAAMTAGRMGWGKEYYQQLRARGMATTAAFVALARKLVRLAFALLRDHSEFDPSRRRACPQT
jgi:transposase